MSTQTVFTIGQKVIARYCTTQSVQVVTGFGRDAYGAAVVHLEMSIGKMVFKDKVYPHLLRSV